MFRNAKNVGYYMIGSGSLAQLGDLIGARRAAVNGPAVFFIDHFFEGKDLIAKLPVESKDMVVYVDTTNEPTTDSIDGYTDKNPAPYKIAVPTLSGTGSETSRTGIICNEEKNIKLGMNSDYTMFEQVLLDPDLTASVPRNQYFYTGIDTYMHCFESITGSYRNVVVDSLAEKAIDLSKQVYLSSDMMSDENREKLMIASFLGGMAAGFVGVVHPLSAGLSMVLHMHHGIANCHALTVLEDIYPNEYKDFMSMMERQGIDLPKGICQGLTDAQYDALYGASIVHEKPLSNRLGPDFKKILTKENVIERFKRM